MKYNHALRPELFPLGKTPPSGGGVFYPKQLTISEVNTSIVTMFKSAGTFTRTTNKITRENQHRLCRLFCARSKPRDVILFPGQGSQYVGMTAHLTKLPSVMRLFETASEILGYDLLEMCLNGPKAELDRTVHCQPAVFVASLAALEKYKEILNIGYTE